MKIIKKIAKLLILCAVCTNYLRASNGVGIPNLLSVVNAYVNSLPKIQPYDFVVEAADQPRSEVEKDVVRACYKGDLFVVKANYKNVRKNIVTFPSGHTLLHIACAKGYVEIVRYLLEHVDDEGDEDLNDEFNINAKNEHGDTPFYCACIGGSLEIVKLLVEYGAYINYGSNDKVLHCDTPLHLACRNGFLDIVKFLVLEKNACINAKNFKGETPIQQACREGFLEIVRFLISEGASLKTEFKDFLNLAVLSGNVDLVKFLLFQGMKFESYGMCNHFLAACKSSSVAMIKFLFERGVCLDVCTQKKKQSPLHLACLKNLSLISFLRSKGCSITATAKRDLDNKTALDLFPTSFPVSVFPLKDEESLDGGVTAELDFIKKVIALQNPKVFFQTSKLERNNIFLKDLEEVKNSEDWLVIIEYFLEAIFGPVMPFETKKDKLTKLQNALCLTLFEKKPFQIIDEAIGVFYPRTNDKRYYENNRYNQALTVSGKTGNSGQINRFVDLKILFESLGAKKVFKKTQTMEKKSSVSLLDSLTEVEMKELETSKTLL